MAETGGGTIGKALALLDEIAEIGRPVRFSELLGQSTHPKATLFRLLRTLTDQGMLSYDEQTQTYAPGLRLVRLAHAAWTQSSLAPVARPFIDRLSADLGTTVHLAQLDGGQVLYVDKRAAANPIPMFSDAGRVGPAYCTGIGKAMMAFLPEQDQQRALAKQSYHRFTAHTLITNADLLAELVLIRKRGFAFDHEEHEAGIICVAAPIVLDSGRMLGGLSITSATTLASLDDLAALAPRLIATARDIAKTAQIWAFPEQHAAE